MDDNKCVQNKFWNVDKKWYLFNDKGEMVDDTVMVNGQFVFINDDGVCNVEQTLGYQNTYTKIITSYLNGEAVKVEKLKVDVDIEPNLKISGDSIIDDVVRRIDKKQSIRQQVDQTIKEVAKMLEYLEPVPADVNVNLYHVLSTKKTVCAGYCNVTKVILDRLGIYSEIVEDKQSIHCWIYYQDGSNSYYCDPTWYDTTGGNESFLSNSIEDFRIAQDEWTTRFGYPKLIEKNVQFQK